MILLDYFACLTALLLIRLVYLHKAKRRQRIPYPPGPQGHAIFRNMFDLPDKGHWPKYNEWAKQLGTSILSLDMIGTRIVVLNDLKSTNDLFNKRGAIYSERPRMPYLNEAGGFDWDWGFTENTQMWKTCRREFDVHFRQATAKKYRPQELRMGYMLLNKLLASPEKFMDHFRYITGSLMLDITYGIHAKLENDPLIDITEIGSFGIEKSGDKNIVNLIPWIQHFPSCLSWLPGMKWKREVDAFRQWGYDMRDVPFAYVKKLLDDGTASPSMTTELMDKLQDGWPDLEAREEIVKGIVGATYIAGSDTTLSLLRFFVLAMVIFPEVQQNAQKELDIILGSQRLPDFSDEDSLPYITAIVKELLRWTSPTAVPHGNARDDIYEGYFIPKNSIVLGNTWAILHDPEVFPEPDRFYPSRFLTAEGRLNPLAPDVMTSFGYGRRICPGRFLALDSLWIAIASILATFHISRVVGPDGQEIVPPPDIDSGLINHPKPFPCIIKPRSEQAQFLIKDSLADI